MHLAPRNIEGSCFYVQEQDNCSSSTTGNSCSWHEVVNMVTVFQCILNIYPYFEFFSQVALYRALRMGEEKHVESDLTG